MRKKTIASIIGVTLGIFFLFVIIGSSSILVPNPSTSDKIATNSKITDDLSIAKINDSSQYKGRIVIMATEVEGNVKTVTLPVDAALFNLQYTLDERKIINSVTISLKPELIDFYHQIGFFDKPSTAVVIYPIFTEAAYGPKGFYDYYNKKCGIECLTVKLPPTISPIYQSSGRAFAILNLLHYDYVTDYDVDTNPEILKKYDKVIVLHNEYVTQKEFDAITSNPHVVYLYPNALYANVALNRMDGTITLIRGHGYPDADIGNGFDWKFDNSKYEYDLKCTNWQFYKIDKGTMLNCYPAFRLYFDKDLLTALRN